MATTNLYSSESWTKIHSAFEQISFVSYDFDTVRQSLLDYLKLYYKETFNDFIESSELIAYVEMFAYISEQLAYRVDIASHENFITTAERKQSILRLAKLVSYSASRNIPARGLVKIQSISTTESVYDSLGNNLSGVTVMWADPNNSRWKEQFFLVINRIMNGKFGQPQKVTQVGDVVFQLYSFNNIASTMSKGVFPYSVSATSQTLNMEIVSSDLDENGPLERAPAPSNSMSVLYVDDGIGDSSDFTGFMLFTKQGNLIRTSSTMRAQVPNQSITVNVTNQNQTDVWVQQLDESGKIVATWSQTDTVNAQNLYFTSNTNRNKYEVETLENDRVRILFGDGNFSNIPSGTFVVWTRQSENTNAIISQNLINNEAMALSYTSSLGLQESVAVTFSLTSALQNASTSEDIEHIRQTAPTTYYSQGRMVNGQDYNTFLLKDPSILRLKTINRTFAGQPKYIDWNDASGNYENVKIFGDDMQMKHVFTQNSISTDVSSRRLIDDVIEPILVNSGLQNALLHIISAITPGVTTIPRYKFIEDVSIIPDNNDLTLKLQEKTSIQGVLDRHWYGEPDAFVAINGQTYASVSTDTDGKIWQANIPTTLDGITEFQRAAGLQSISDLPSFGLHYTPFFFSQNNATLTNLHTTLSTTETFTVEISADTNVAKVTGSMSGVQPAATVGIPYVGLLSFTINAGAVQMIPGDAFILDINASVVTERTFTTPAETQSRINLSGRWSVIAGNLIDDTQGVFDPNTPSDLVHDSSWLIKVDRNTDSAGNIVSFTVTYRDLKVIVTSPTTKFWYNSSASIIDYDTKQIVRDKILVLKSNLNADQTKPIGKNDSYDVIGDVRDNFGNVDISSLEVVPSMSINRDIAQALNPLQFEKFAANNYQYFKHEGIPSVKTSIISTAVPVEFNSGAISVYDEASTDLNPIFYTRVMTRGIGDNSIDFMWQHFSPFGNLIDPAPSNIHDAFILTSGYYSQLRDYIDRRSTSVPVEPTPLELRSSYGTLLRSKMLSDTVVLHPAKMKLLFGSLARPELRAKFRVVKNNSGSLTSEQIRNEILLVINDYFAIENWDFGDTFYATELIALIHQKLPLDVASVVIVPIYSNNSFGSLFTIESSQEEILQSVAQLQDIELVDYLSSSVLRQGAL